MSVTSSLMENTLPGDWLGKANVAPNADHTLSQLTLDNVILCVQQLLISSAHVLRRHAHAECTSGSLPLTTHACLSVKQICIIVTQFILRVAMQSVAKKRT